MSYKTEICYGDREYRLIETAAKAAQQSVDEFVENAVRTAVMAGNAGNPDSLFPSPDAVHKQLTKKLYEVRLLRRLLNLSMDAQLGRKPTP